MEGSRVTYRTVVPARIVLMRERHGWTQAELAESMTEECERVVSAISVSTWETGRRPVAGHYRKVLAKVLGCTLSYLTGLSNDPDEEYIDEDKKDTSDKLEIYYKELKKLDGTPIYVQFNHLVKPDGWALVDAKKNRLVFKDYILKYKEDEFFFRDIHLFKDEPSYNIHFDSANKKALDLSSMLEVDPVYIIHSTPNDYLRAQYSGWFHHTREKSCLINDKGFVLPYEGLGVSYKAFAPMNVVPT